MSPIVALLCLFSPMAVAAGAHRASTPSTRTTGLPGKRASAGSGPARIGRGPPVQFFLSFPYGLCYGYARALLTLKAAGKFRLEPQQEKTIEPVS